MMKKSRNWFKKLFFPPDDANTAIRLLPYGIIILLLFAVAIGGAKAWEYTNTTTFCGTACHTMPPQYVTHQLSDHARVTCEDCHLGRAELGTQIIRKIQYSYQTGSATVLNNYELPIFAKNMRPARDVCETCHYPLTFSSDKLVELKEYGEDINNTPKTTFLVLKTAVEPAEKAWALESIGTLKILFLSMRLMRKNKKFLISGLKMPMEASKNTLTLSQILISTNWMNQNWNQWIVCPVTIAQHMPSRTPWMRLTG